MSYDARGQQGASAQAAARPNSGRVGLHDLARTLVIAVSQELIAA